MLQRTPNLSVLCALSLRLFAACVVLAGCDDGDGPYYGRTTPRHGPDELWYNLGGNPEYVDPALCTDSQSGVVVTNLFSSLVQLHPQTLEPLPDIAQRWEVFDGGRRYRFYLRESQWSDGHPLTADDFLFSFRRVLDPRTLSRYAVLLYPLLYAEQVNKQALVVEGVSEVDEGALRRWVEQVDPQLVPLRAPEIDAVYLTPEGTWNEAAQMRALNRLRALPLLGKPRAVRSAVPEDLGVARLDEHVLEIRLREPAPYVLPMLAFRTAAPVPRHVLAAVTERGQKEIDWTRPENIVTNGPYVLKEWAFREYMVLEKNPHYWDVEHVKLPRVRLLMIESYNTTLNMYKAGELDDIGTSAQVPAEFLDRLQKYKDFRRFDYLSVYLLWLNTNNPKLSDPRVRRALSLAIDRQSLVRYVLRGGQKPTADLVPDKLAGYRGLGLPQFDPKKARALLQEAGYGPGHPFPEITYVYNTAEQHKQIAEALQQMWRTNLGIHVNIENQEWRVFLKTLNKREFEIARLGWIADYADPDTYLQLLLSSNENNHAGWSSLAYDRALRAANQQVDVDKRLAMLREVEAMGLASQPLIPLYVYTRSEMVKPYVRNAYVNQLENDYFRFMSIDERFYDGAPAQLPPDSPVLPDPVLLAADGGGDADAGTGSDAGQVAP